MISDMESLNIDQHLDVKGLNCPMPVLRTKIVLTRMSAGQLLSVLTTDPHSVPDFRAFCEHTGHELIQINETEGVFEFLIRRAQP